MSSQLFEEDKKEFAKKKKYIQRTPSSLKNAENLFKKAYYLEKDAKKENFAKEKRAKLKQALELYLKAANDGSCNARLRLYTLYSSPKECYFFGIRPDAEIRFYFLTFASYENEDHFAQYRLGAEMGDVRKSLILFIESAKKGNALAMHRLAELLEKNKKLFEVEDDKLPEELFHCALRRGNPSSILELSKIEKKKKKFKS